MVTSDRTRLAQTHLPVAIGEAVLQGPERALRDAIGRPLAHHVARLLRIAEVGQACSRIRLPLSP